MASQNPAGARRHTGATGFRGERSSDSRENRSAQLSPSFHKFGDVFQAPRAGVERSLDAARTSAGATKQIRDGICENVWLSEAYGVAIPDAFRVLRMVAAAIEFALSVV